MQNHSFDQLLPGERRRLLLNLCLMSFCTWLNCDLTCPWLLGSFFSFHLFPLAQGHCTGFGHGSRSCSCTSTSAIPALLPFPCGLAALTTAYEQH